MLGPSIIMNIHQIPNKNDLIIVENEKILELKKALISIEEDRASGKSGYTLDA